MKKKENTLTLSKEQKTAAIIKIKEYITENFDTEIGSLQAEIFLDYLTNNIGVYYYNNAIADSMTFISEKIEDMYLLMKDEEI